MKKLIKITAVLVLCLLGKAVNASGTYTVNIARAHVNTDSGFYIRTEEAMQDPDGCGTNPPSWYQINPTGIYSKELYATVLSAKAMGRPMEIYLAGCVGSYPQLTWGNVK